MSTHVNAHTLVYVIQMKLIGRPRHMGGGLLWQTAFQSASKPCLYLQIVFLASHVIKKPFGSILSLDREGNRR